MLFADIAGFFRNHIIKGARGKVLNLRARKIYQRNQINPSILLPDPDGEPFLEVALGINTMAIITGNKRHFLPKKNEGVKILSSVEFLRELKKII